jgi:FtsZ-interacting cell division protein ZipA
MIRTTFHILLGALLWLVFGYYWYLVMQQPVTDETKRALMIVGAIVAVITIFDALWIIHNIRIARFGKRRTRRTAAEPPVEDFLGRAFIAQSEEALRAARYIEVHVVEIADGENAVKHKLLRISEPEPETR